MNDDLVNNIFSPQCYKLMLFSTFDGIYLYSLHLYLLRELVQVEISTHEGGRRKNQARLVPAQ